MSPAGGGRGAVAEEARHRLAARNLVVGETDFLDLRVPAPWRITRAVVTPEVRTTIRVGSRTWVVSGETRHVVFDRDRRVGLDLVVRAFYKTSRLPSRALEVVKSGHAVCNGHGADYRIVRRRRGFLVRGEERALQVAFGCPPTGRGLLIEVSGSCSVDDLRGFLRALEDVECH